MGKPMFVEVIRNIKVKMDNFSGSVFAYMAEDGTRFISAIPLVKFVGELEFGKAKQFCSHGTVRLEFCKVEIRNVEIDLLSLEDEEKMRRVMGVLLGKERPETLELALQDMRKAKSAISDPQ